MRLELLSLNAKNMQGHVEYTFYLGDKMHVCLERSLSSDPSFSHGNRASMIFTEKTTVAI
jgi:hypothetical protein